MFIGHYGVALALKRVEPKVSLGTLVAAAAFVDLLWVVFVQVGWEHVYITPHALPASNFEFIDYPLSHSLVAAAVWAIVVGAIYYSWPTRDTGRHFRAAVVVGLAVASHWFVDLVVHVPDLPLAGNDSPKLGLGLWRSLPATLLVELATFGLGLAIYFRYASAKHPVHPVRLALWSTLLVGLLFADLYVPPPPDFRMVFWSMVIGAPIFIALAAWADKAMVGSR